MFYNNSILQQSQQSLNLDETNGNVVMPSTSTSSTSNVLVPMSPTSNDEEDKSEYTDADSNQISAPTELLAEFLSAVMQKDYKNALKYCKLILQYEPNNATAKDFYPHILSKIHEQKNSSSEGSDEHFNYTSSMEFVDLDNDNDQVDLLPDQEDNLSQASLPSIASTVSSSDENYPDFNDEGGGSDYSNTNSENSEQNSDKDNEGLIPESVDSNPASNSSSILPEHKKQKSSFSLTSSSSNYSNKEDTSHSYTSLLLEEDDDAEMLPVPPMQEMQQPLAPTSSPMARKIVEMFKAKCIPGHSPFKSKET